MKEQVSQFLGNTEWNYTSTFGPSNIVRAKDLVFDAVKVGPERTSCAPAGEEASGSRSIEWTFPTAVARSCGKVSGASRNSHRIVCVDISFCFWIECTWLIQVLQVVDGDFWRRRHRWTSIANRKITKFYRGRQWRRRRWRQQGHESLVKKLRSERETSFPSSFRRRGLWRSQMIWRSLRHVGLPKWELMGQTQWAQCCVMSNFFVVNAPGSRVRIGQPNWWSQGQIGTSYGWVS